MVTSSPVVTVFIQTENIKAEKRFEKSLLIADLFGRLEIISGVPSNQMIVTVSELGIQLEPDRMLGVL
jgi:hypothetical protein